MEMLYADVVIYVFKDTYNLHDIPVDQLPEMQKCLLANLKFSPEEEDKLGTLDLVLVIGLEETIVVKSTIKNDEHKGYFFLLKDHTMIL